MDTVNKNKLEQDLQVDRMIDEGLGAGRIIEKEDTKKFSMDHLAQKTEDDRDL
ncbi:hypothetical protein [Caldalkalibacillus mannanilyticus]|uniref:hypothetical protein n=1 Tax=Caldalkalibacillus mannanilyticus TaxID=1418 RepID=UPI000B1783E3|nr:hypothetical protein [Caldalkalibacillus mannanilyticus]